MFHEIKYKQEIRDVHDYVNSDKDEIGLLLQAQIVTELRDIAEKQNLSSEIINEIDKLENLIGSGKHAQFKVLATEIYNEEIKEEFSPERFQF